MDSPTALDAATTDGDEAADSLEWSVHLARTAPHKVAVVILAIVVSAALCFYLFHNLLFAGFVAIALVGATAEFLFPIRYRVNAAGVEMRNLHQLRRMEWREVRKAYLQPDGVKLSPLALPTRLEAFRGILLRFGPGAGSEEAVLAAIRKFRDAVRSNTH